MAQAASPRRAGAAAAWALAASFQQKRSVASGRGGRARFQGISRSTLARPQVPVTPAKTRPAPTKPDSA